jgi:hypothetical protein
MYFTFVDLTIGQGDDGTIASNPSMEQQVNGASMREE